MFGLFHSSLTFTRLDLTGKGSLYALGIAAGALVVAWPIFVLLPRWRYFIACTLVFLGLSLIVPAIVVSNEWIKVSDSAALNQVMDGLLIGGIVAIAIGTALGYLVRYWGHWWGQSNGGVSYADLAPSIENMEAFKKSESIVGFDDVHVWSESDGCRTHVRWDELLSVKIETTDLGPMADDVLFLLAAADKVLVYQSGAPGGDALLERLQQLSGFDNSTAIEAMSCVENKTFVCWGTNATD